MLNLMGLSMTTRPRRWGGGGVKRREMLKEECTTVLDPNYLKVKEIKYDYLKIAIAIAKTFHFYAWTLERA